MNQTNMKPAGLFTQNIWLFAIPVVGAIVMVLPADVRQLLYLHLELSRSGEFWRLISGHFVYVSWLHWSLNTLGILLFWLFFRESRHSNMLLPAIVFILLIVSAGLMELSVKLVWYAGFSGILSGLFAYGAITSFVKNPGFSVGLLLILSIYVFIQINSGELVDGGLESVRTSSYAHAFGLIAGVIYGLLAIVFTGLARKNK